VIAGLSNTYSDYITTFEEYSVQRYEGASTIFGPYTLLAYIQEFNKLAVAIAKVYHCLDKIVILCEFIFKIVAMIFFTTL